MRKYGTLTVENCQDFYNALAALIENKLFTFIAVNESFGTRAEVKVNQYLRGASVRPGTDKTYPSRETHPAGSAKNMSLTVEQDKKYCFITVCDSYGVFSISDGTYFEFHEADRYHPARVTLDFKAGAGNNIQWTIYPTGDLPPDSY
jgi:hypothetical protein